MVKRKRKSAASTGQGTEPDLGMQPKKQFRETAVSLTHLQRLRNAHTGWNT